MVLDSHFMSLMTAKDNKPVWQSYSTSSSKSSQEKLKQELPSVFKSSGSGQTADIYNGSHLSCIFEPASALLPNFTETEEDGSKREKSYKITVSCLIG